MLAAYLHVAQHLASRSLSKAPRTIAAGSSIALCLGALGFKVAFTKADAPELLVGLHWFVLKPMEEASLVSQARAVFIGIALIGCFTAGAKVSKPVEDNETSQGICRYLQNLISHTDMLSRPASVAPRSIDAVPHDRVSGHEYTCLPPVRIAVPCHAIARPLNVRADINLDTIPAFFVLRVRWFQRDILSRSFKCVQRHKRV